MVVREYENDSVHLLCEVCGVELAEIFYPSPIAHQIIHINSCSHYEWEQVGLACWEDPSMSDLCQGVEGMVTDHVFHIEDGGSVYVLLPRTLR